MHLNDKNRTQPQKRKGFIQMQIQIRFLLWFICCCIILIILCRTIVLSNEIDIINLKMTNRNDKQDTYFLFQLSYAQISHHQQYPYLNDILTVLQYTLLLLQCYTFIDPTLITSLALPYFTILIVFVSLLIFFVLFTIFTYQFSLLSVVWLYFIMFLQSISIVYTQITARCFMTDTWCAGDIKAQFFTIVTIIAFTIIIYVRSHCYYPFYQSSNHLSMNSGKTIIHLYVYALLMSLTSHGIFAESISERKYLAFIFSCGLFALTLSPASASPVVCRLHYVLVAVLLWTTALVWLAPMLADVLGTTYSIQAFWYYWGYSIPLVLVLRIIQSRFFNKGYEWKSLFLEQKISSLRDLYLQCNSLIKIMNKVKESEIGTNSAQFKQLWELIRQHNDKCTVSLCPLAVVSTLRVQRGDELLEQKRFSKTVQKILQFGLLQLTKQKGLFPNLIELTLQIANYELQIFHLRTKGLQLFNRQFNKEERTKEQKWGIFYLKKKIDNFEGQGQMRVTGENPEEISLFRHDIEVSVTMLAQFWYFLSDPKCNLKKLYDLANVLFPLKIGVDKTWKSIRQLQNIESYHLYARYLIKMFNDKEKGLRILDEAKKLQQSSNQKEDLVAGVDKALSQELGVIFLQFDGKNSGVMYQVNTSCEKIFGYNKGELQGRKVNDIMPKLIATYHDRILEDYQQTNKPYLMNKQRPLWGRAKDGYLFPFVICIKPVKNYYSQTSEVYASIKRDLWVRETSFLFTDQEFNITDASASLIGMFPDVHGKLFLKKKMYISEIVPNFEEIKNSLINQKEVQQMQIKRIFKIGRDEAFTETILLTVQVEEATIHLSGRIGYLFRFLKNTGLSNHEVLPNSSNVSIGLSRVKETNIEASNSYWMKRYNDFQFLASVSEESENNCRKMTYHGGLAQDHNQTKSLIHSRIKASFQTSQLSKQIEVEQKIEYGKDIKIKRLQANNIRQIQQLSEPSENNGVEGNNDQEQEQVVNGIQPSELNSILQRQIDNKHITSLKIITILILVISTVTSVLIYVAHSNHNNNVIGYLDALIALSSMESEVMYVNMLANKYYLGLATVSDIAILKEEIAELDRFAEAIPLSVSCPIFYSDGTSQEMLLSFAVNKLISQAQLIASSITIPTSSSDLYFVVYNSVNGIEVGCETAIQIQQKAISTEGDNISNTYLIYLGVSCAAFVVILVLKNIILRAVLKKKAEILNIFFEIPRVACSSIQKQCERFIQKLSDHNQEDQLDAEGEEEQEEESTTKKGGRHKKRTIMGEEQTAYNFVVASILLLLFLLVYPVVILSLSKSQKANENYILQAVSSVAQVEKQLAKLMSYMDTHLINSNFSLQNNPSAQAVINNQYNLVLADLTSIQKKFFNTGDILDSTYLGQYNSLFFNNLCSNASKCMDAYQQNKGLNSILFYYYDYVIGRYQTANSMFLNSSSLSTDNDLRTLIKTYWRQFQEISRMGTLRFLQRNDAWVFGIMLTICIFDMTVLMWVWLRFYVSLQQKIIATEYILTFIPIDEINKNPKIVKYIKQHVLHIQ